MRKATTILLSKTGIIIQSFLGAIISFLTPIIPLILIVISSIIFDTLVGLWRCKKLSIDITSRGLSEIAGKLFLYCGSLVLFFVVDKYIIGDFIGIATSIPLVLTKLVATVFIYIELKSIQENVEQVTGVSFLGKLKDMIGRVKSIKKDIQE